MFVLKIVVVVCVRVSVCVVVGGGVTQQENKLLGQEKKKKKANQPKQNEASVQGNTYIQSQIRAYILDFQKGPYNEACCKNHVKNTKHDQVINLVSSDSGIAWNSQHHICFCLFV